MGPKVRNFAVGDMVYRPIARYDRPGNTCDLGFAWGGFAERGIITDGRAIVEDNPGTEMEYWWPFHRTYPADIPAEDAIIMITLMETWSWLELFGVTKKTSLMLWGLGPVGLSMAVCAQAMGVPVLIGADISETSLKRAADFGVKNALDPFPPPDFKDKVMALTGGKGVDRIGDAVGSRKLIMQSEDYVAHMGRIGVYGIEPSKPGEAPKPFSLMGTGQHSLHFIQPDEISAHDTLIQQYLLHKVEPKKFITHRLPLSEINEGFELIRQQKAIKVIIEIGK